MSTTTDPLPCQNISTVVNDIQHKLQKLDILDSISERLQNIEGNFDIVEKDMSQLKQSVNVHDQRLNTNDQDMRGFHHRIAELERARDELSVLISELQ
jgi:chromosome segregation ATPase